MKQRHNRAYVKFNANGTRAEWSRFYSEHPADTEECVNDMISDLYRYPELRPEAEGSIYALTECIESGNVSFHRQRLVFVKPVEQPKYVQAVLPSA